MRYLSQFNKFDWESFSHGKEFLVVGCGQWIDYDTKEHLGSKVDCTIYTDDTPYNQREGETMTNRFEKVTFKVRQKNINVPVNSMITAHDVKATIYGEHRNQLSVTCESMTVNPQPQQAAPKEVKQ